MKRTWKTIATGMQCTLAALAMTTIVACDKEEEKIKDVPQPDTTGLMLDGGSINGITMRCGGDYAVKTLTDYSSLNLQVEMETINKYQPDPEDDVKMKEYRTVRELTQDYYREKTKFIKQEYNTIPKADFYTAYVNGEVSITCDKTLFGQESGKNIGKFFKLGAPTDYMPIGIDQPQLLYKSGDKLPDNVADFFPMHSWVLDRYWLTLHSIPEEKYDELTFKFTFPMITEYSYKYNLSKFRGIDEELIRKEEIFEAECLVKFNWE